MSTRAATTLMRGIIVLVFNIMLATGPSEWPDVTPLRVVAHGLMGWLYIWFLIEFAIAKAREP